MNLQNNVFTIAHPPGVGDIYWCALLMEDFKKQNGIPYLCASIHRDYGHLQAEEGAKIFSVYDSVKSGPLQSWEYSKPLKRRLWNIRASGNEVDLRFEMNTPLEKGIRLEHCTKYKPNWDLELKIHRKDKYLARQLLVNAVGHDPYVVFYMAEDNCNNNWNKNTWKKTYWGALAGKFISHGMAIVIIGSEKDSKYAESVRFENKEKMVSICGQTSLPQVAHIINQSRAVVAFPSGMGILAVHQKVPTVMFWSIQKVSPNGAFLPGFMTSWVRPDMVGKGYVPVPYGSKECDPDFVFDACLKARHYLMEERYDAKTG